MKKLTLLFAGIALASGAALAGGDMDKGKAFEDVDSNGDGRVSQAEISTDPATMTAASQFTRADTDRNGYLNKDEYEDLQAILSNAEEEEAE